MKDLKEKIFAFCDLEESYAFRMAEYIMEKLPAAYVLHLFTEAGELQRFMETHEIFILVAGESVIEGLKVREDIPNVFILQESRRETGGNVHRDAEKGAGKNADRNTKKDREEDGKYTYIDKFQSPQQIVGELTECMAQWEEWNERKRAQAERFKIIGIYSPVRRCLQTSFALTMGQLLSKEHKVLYLNFECYSGFSQMLQKEFPEDMLDVLYYFNCAREKLSVRLPSIVQNINGLDFIPPGLSGLDMQGIAAEQWVELLELMERVSDYEYLVLDLTDSMNGLFELLSRCYRIYTITRDDGFAMAKMSQYEQILQFHKLYDIAEKTVKCRFPFFEKLPADIGLMTHGELAGYVKAIIQEDLYGQEAG